MLIGIIIASLLFCLLCVSAIIWKRERPKRRDIKDFEVTPGAGAVNLMSNFALGDTPGGGIAINRVQDPTVTPAALTQRGDRLWADFCRVVSFDHQYFGNDLLALDDKQLEDAYALLGVTCPTSSFFGPLRQVGARFGAQEIKDVEGDDVMLDDLVDFLFKAMPDVLMERAIDVCALGNGDASQIFDDYKPESNPFLYDKGGCRELLYDAAHREVHHVDPLYYEPNDNEYNTCGGDGGETVYGMANGRGNDYGRARGRGSANYGRANRGSGDVYAVATRPEQHDDVYAKANNRDSVASGDVYAMAGLDDAKTDEYAIANGALDSSTDDYDLAVRALSALSNDYDVTRKGRGFSDPDYDVSTTDADCDNVYDISTTNADCIYDVSTTDTDCDYDLSTMVGAGQDQVYDTAGHIGGDQVYDTAAGIQLRGADDDDDNDDIYALAASSTDDDIYALAGSMADCDTDEAVYDMTKPVPRSNANYGRAGGRGDAGGDVIYDISGGADDRVYETATDVRTFDFDAADASTDVHALRTYDTSCESTDDDVIRPIYGRAGSVRHLQTYDTAEASTDDATDRPVANYGRAGARGRTPAMYATAAGVRGLPTYEVAEASTDDDDVITPQAYEGTVGTSSTPLTYETAGGKPLATYEVAEASTDDDVITPQAYEGTSATPLTYETAGGMPLATYEVAEASTDDDVITPQAYEGTSSTSATPLTYETAGGMPLASYEVAEAIQEDGETERQVKPSVTAADITAIVQDFAEMEQDMKGGRSDVMEDDNGAPDSRPQEDYVDMGEAATASRSEAALSRRRSTDVEEDDTPQAPTVDDYVDMTEASGGSKPSTTHSSDDAMPGPEPVLEEDDASTTVSVAEDYVEMDEDSSGK